MEVVLLLPALLLREVDECEKCLVPVIAVNEKPNIDINSQRVYGTVPSEQNAGVVQEVVHDENVSFDRDGDTMRVCYMCCCGRQKQIFFAIPN
ncbi:hypothetical protein MKW98_013711 [Papaver atlanticum]|uniref:Uncharacterized protein n=1 Tax=Papaver atlanticum TaxID=357466 RepID=A0AAD4SDR5_9MAGN|nr:hypothetical protein MKW98_013711 [Papaver atlanticum]